MDLLREAISESKGSLSGHSKLPSKKASWKRSDSSDSESEDDAPKKYMRRGEIEKLRDRQREEKRAREDADVSSVGKKQKIDEAQTSSDGANGGGDNDESDEDEDEMMDEFECKLKLRSYNQPITLFGETKKDRHKRLKTFELDFILRHGGSMGKRNDLQEILAQEVENEIAQASLAAMESELSVEEAQKIKDKKTKQMQKKMDKYAEAKGRECFSDIEKYIEYFFKRILSLWEGELDARSDEEKRTKSGKITLATYKQTRQYIKPLFKDMKKGETPKDVILHVGKMVDACYKREYVEANEHYLKCAIGNAAWPMGVTMVGIHERAGRSKLNSANVAHVLNNEHQRKYIQSIKRLMTAYQRHFPTVPSKTVTS